MADPAILIVLGDAEAVHLRGSTVEVEVELDDELASFFTLRLGMTLDGSRDWSFVDDDRLVPWAPITISAGFDGGVEELIRGVITRLEPTFDPDPTRCTLGVRGMDHSALLDRVQVRAAWPGKKHSEIATEIFEKYALTPDVDDTLVVHEEAVSTILQHETDMQFLTRLAARHGFECYVRGKTGHFHALRLDKPPQPPLAAYFRADTTLERFSVEVNATTPTEVALTQLDPFTPEIVDVTVTETSLPLLGKLDATALEPAGGVPARVVLSQVVTTGAAEATALCQAAYDQSRWFVHASGEVNGNVYGHVLEPRRTVAIKGLGETHSGLYYVTHVTHVLRQDAYVQRFRAKRNAVHLTGDEDFGSAGGPLDAL
jgi:phage protein D